MEDRDVVFNVSENGTPPPAHQQGLSLFTSPQFLYSTAFCLDSCTLMLLHGSHLITLLLVMYAGLGCSSMTKGWAGGRATVGATAGRLYFEVTLEDSGLCRAGWASRAAAFEIGRDRRSFGFGSTAKKSHGGAFADYGKPFGKVTGCHTHSLNPDATAHLQSKHAR